MMTPPLLHLAPKSATGEGGEAGSAGGTEEGRARATTLQPATRSDPKRAVSLHEQITSLAGAELKATWAQINRSLDQPPSNLLERALARARLKAARLNKLLASAARLAPAGRNNARTLLELGVRRLP